MTGLQTLMATGLNLAVLDQQPPFPTGTLRWHRVAEGVLPDADTTVLMWVLYGDGQDWAVGWWDGEVWRDAASGGDVAGCVAYWCEPQGPQA